MEYTISSAASATSQSLSTNHDQIASSLSSSRQAPQKRNRTQLSCTNCRHAKLKCDRQKPCCSQCAKKGKASLCTFPSPAQRKPTESMRNRLKHLESLVKDVMTGQTPSSKPAVNDEPNHSKGLDNSTTSNGYPIPNDNLVPNQKKKDATEASSDSSGQVLFGSRESTYVGATHWAAILEDIDEMKTYFDEEIEDTDEDENLKSYTSLIFNVQSPSSKTELLALLPQRSVVNVLVSRYFNSNSPALHILHRPTFQRNYRKFWADPHGTPVIFLALLFSLMTVATIAAVGTGEENPVNGKSAMEVIKTYRECSVQCLVLSNYTKPGSYTLETLFIYMEVEFLISKDDQVLAFLLVGNTVRLALRMGLHRDSTKVGGNITPFEAEIRRRLWHHLLQIDLLSCFHIGLPGMIQAIDSDTLLPGNLRDEDFDEDSVVLPQPRPDSEITPMSYTICKSRLCQEAGRIVVLANRLSLPEYEEVMNLDRDLQVAHRKIPPAFLLDSTGPSITDSPVTTIRQFSLAILFQKSRCMLHRKHLMKAEKNPHFAFSKRAGLDASMELLRCQSMVHDAALPGGALSRDRWFLSSLSMHDFLLGATIVYLSLLGRDVRIFTPGIVTKEQQERIDTLEKSRAIWNTTWSISAEAKKASLVLEFMVSKVRSALSAELSSSHVSSFTASGSEEARGDGLSSLSFNDQPVSHGQIVDTLLPTGSWATGTTENTTPSPGLEMPSGFNLASTQMSGMEPLGALFDVSNDFDWEMFDNQLRPQEVAGQAWPDFMEFAPENNGNYN